MSPTSFFITNEPGGVADLFIGEKGKAGREKADEVEKAFLRKHLLGQKAAGSQSKREGSAPR